MGSTTCWGKKIIDGFEAGNRHLEAAGGGPLLHPISWLNF